MIRLNMIVEGQTEERFVNDVLQGHLASYEIYVAVRCVETSRDKKRHKIYRGGMIDYRKAKNDIIRWMKEDQKPEAWFTTMFDLYALPDDFPGYAEARKASTPQLRIDSLEAALKNDINHPRFIPYLQLHEFEAFLLADPFKFDWIFIEHSEAIKRLATLTASFASPEDINDDPTNAPSKRIIHEVPEYEFQKASAGPIIASKIGLQVLRQKCPHFDCWITRLENLS
jgi:hypothetical protein